MLKVEKMVTMSPEQWEIVIEGMRNPHDSWDKIDSYMTHVENAETGVTAPFEFFVGEADQKLMENLRDGGPVHAKYRRMMPIWMTITAPLYWWKEFDTYKIGVTTNSCSTMHRIHAKEFTREDFSHEHLFGWNIPSSYNPEHDCFPQEETDGHEVLWASADVLDLIIDALNFYRERFLETKNKKYWWQMIQLLPTSYNQKRTVMITYEVVANMRKWRWNHKQDEWRDLCQYLVDNLPYVELTDEKDVVSEYKQKIEMLEKELAEYKRKFKPTWDELRGEK